MKFVIPNEARLPYGRIGEHHRRDHGQRQQPIGFFPMWAQAWLRLSPEWRRGALRSRRRRQRARLAVSFSSRAGHWVGNGLAGTGRMTRLENRSPVAASRIVSEARLQAYAGLRLELTD